MLSDPDQALAARWLKIALWILSVGFISIIGTMFTADLPPQFFASLLAVDIVSLAINIGCWVLLKRGAIRLSVFLLIITLFLLTTYANLALFRNIEGPGIIAYFVLIPLANLLLGKLGMNLVAIYSMLVLVATFYFEQTSTAIISMNRQHTWSDVFVLLVAIFVTTLISNAAMRRLEESAEAIQQTANALATANTQLYISQMELQQAQLLLENRVRQRTAELQKANEQLEKEAVERQRGVEALRTSEAQWRSLVENVPELIVTLAPSGHIQFINRALDTHVPEMLIGAPVTALHTQEQAKQQLQQALAQVLQSGRSVSYESEETTEQGVRWQINRLGAIQEEGQVTALILIATDITEQKQTQAAMHQSQKLESLGLLAGGVAHDFNNLLTAMLIQLSAALLKLPEDHVVRPNLQKSIKATERAAELTRQMLNYAGRTPTEIKPVDLNDLLADNIHLFSAAMPKNVTLTSQLSGTIPLVQGDKSQLQQLLMNLILNAADAIGHQNGTVTVKTSLHDLSAEENHYWRWTGDVLTPDRYVMVEVQDTGCGMDDHTLTRIFDPFFTTKFTGRGLGLASVLGIVRAHKGGLNVTSTVGKGTTFGLLFPAIQGVVALGDEPPTLEPIRLPSGLVLLIDDEEDVREATATMLREVGLEVITAADGPPGIALFHQQVNEIKLVLLDLAMPEMDGADVLQALKAINPAIPVILVSGYDETAFQGRLDTNGLITFLPKPYTTSTLLQQIQKQIHFAGQTTASVNEHRA